MFGLKLPIFLRGNGGLGTYSPNVVIDPKKTILEWTRRLSHQAWKSVHRFDLGAGLRKKVYIGEDNTVINVTKWQY